MADITDCEGNIISPLGHFKKLSPVSSASVVQLPVSVCSPPPCTALSTSTTVSFSTRSTFTLTTPSPASVISVSSAGAKSPVTGGLRGYEYVSFDDLTMIYRQAIKIKKERDLALKQNVKLNKMLKSFKRKEKAKQLPRSPAPVQTSDMATQVDGDSTTVSSLPSSWHTLLLQLRAQSSTELQNRKATITMQAKKMLAKDREIERLTSKVASLTHYNNQAHLALQQNLSVYSSSITGSVFDSTMSDLDPAERVTPEPEPTLPPPAELPRPDDSIQISQMLDSVDRLARVYSPPDRYHKPSNDNLFKPRNDVEPDKLFNFEFAALWMNANDATEEEEAEYDRQLEKELRMTPIHSPHLRKPVVNWNRLNPGQFKNLPKADKIPVQGCSPDPNFYLAVQAAYDWRYNTLKWNSTNRFPFGSLYGFETNLGIVSVPDVAIHGYRCSEIYGYWTIDAMG